MSKLWYYNYIKSLLVKAFGVILPLFSYCMFKVLAKFIFMEKIIKYKIKL